MRQEKVTGGLRRAGRSLKRQKAGGVRNALSNVLKKRNSLSRTAPRLLCTLEPGLDTKLKFALEAPLAQSGFQQWYDAFRAVARLPSGIPREWRRRVWLTLADHYLHSISIDWEKTQRFVFSDSCNPDDDSVGLQIVKDLHRTGCSSYCGREAEDGRGVLKQVLLAYARWNQSVGYCQGFHILAAFILEVVEGDEGDALKIMILLIDKVLPGNYFVDNLRGLSVDMAVFRELLRIRLPELSDHLEALQSGANAESSGGYEPPLTNVFAMQWFLTLFATCLPTHTILKIWDSVFFEGSEIILRVALAIWEKLGEQTEWCRSADEFYSTMGGLTQEMLEGNLIDGPELIQTVYSMAPFPLPQLVELRDTFTYNITPFPAPVKSASFSGYPNRMPNSDEESDFDDEAGAVGCLGPISGLLAPELQRNQKHIRGQGEEQNAGSITHLSPGAVHSSHGEHQALLSSMMMERMTTDISFLQRQYCSMKRRQLQQKHRVYITADKGPVSSVLLSPINHPLVVNHLLIGKRLETVNNSGSINHLRASKSLILSSEKKRERLDSTCCTQVSEKRRNIARTKCHLGCGGTNGVIQGPRDLRNYEACTVPGKEDLVQDLVRNRDDSGRTAVKDDGLSSEPALQGENTLTVVQSKFEALELNSIKDTKEKPQMTSFIQSSSERFQRGHVFTPFPNIKPLRQSATARNLGLYGQNCRTPAVNFPHIRKKKA